MQEKILLVTYNAMEGIPVGRYEVGRAIVHSGDYGRDEFQVSDLEYIVLSAHGIGHPRTHEMLTVAEAKLSEIAASLSKDIGNVNEAYVYVGVAAEEGAMSLIKVLQARGKTVHMVACDCDAERKRGFSKKLGIQWIESECGGRETCKRLIESFVASAGA